MGPRRAALALGAGLAIALANAGPARAWGPFAHVSVAARVSRVLTPGAPWLAAQEPAFVWGAVCRGLWMLGPDAPRRAALLDPAADAALLRSARARQDAAALAFALGWRLHREIEALTPDEEPATAWGADAYLWRHAPESTQDAYRRAVLYALGPAGAATSGLLVDLGVPKGAPAAFARLNALWLSASVDAYPQARAQSVPGGSRLGLAEPHSLPGIESRLAEATRLGIESLTPLLARDRPAPAQARGAP